MEGRGGGRGGPRGRGGGVLRPAQARDVQGRRGVVGQGPGAPRGGCPGLREAQFRVRKRRRGDPQAGRQARRGPPFAQRGEARAVAQQEVELPLQQECLQGLDKRPGQLLPRLRLRARRGAASPQGGEGGARAVEGGGGAGGGADTHVLPRVLSCPQEGAEEPPQGPPPVPLDGTRRGGQGPGRDREPLLHQGRPQRRGLHGPERVGAAQGRAALGADEAAPVSAAGRALGGGLQGPDPPR
mmetsp:Transcript_32713/g.83735  ORF Transcript_32713/g.83735 Transcript_32713/m.83735 type:complete len:241 (+) Transcript_32713:2485-3207(+)